MTIIQIKNLTKRFKVFKKPRGIVALLTSVLHREYEFVNAVKNISFAISQGELVGFIGPNGAGKTTTLKCLSGLLYPTSGSVRVLGFTPYDRNSLFLKKISLVMGQKNQLWWDLPAIETFKLNKEIYDISDVDYKSILDELSTLLSVQRLLTTPVRQLSLGERMRMELIAALLHKPKVLFLDEPTIGLDVVMQKKMREFIAEYNMRYQSTILLTSHYMADVKQLCKRIIIIDHGSIIYDGLLTRLIEKYADFKMITFQSKDKRINATELKQYGAIKKYQSQYVSLAVSKRKSNEVAGLLLKKYSIDDLNIEEPELEEVIRLVFNRKKNE